ncbi:hypothetical protein ACKI1O_34565 [Streptomyces scabiei]
MTRAAAATVPVPSAPARPEPAAYDRAAWERAVMASSMHSNCRLIAMVLAHHADEHGRITGGAQDAELLAQESGVQAKYVRISLNQLERRRYMRRPSIQDWPDDAGIRPITLTPRSSSRAEPPSTGEPR